MERLFYVYILASRTHNFYIGVTNNIERRVEEHRAGAVPGFTSRYNVNRLVHLEIFGDPRDVIAREKELKGWRREKKIAPIEKDNPTWTELLPRRVARAKETADPSSAKRRPLSG
jgi:putative endonuclease